MSIFNWLTKQKQSEQVDIIVADHSTKSVPLWEVRWQSRNGSFSCNVRPELESFTSEEAANAFAKSLRDAFKLVRVTADNSVSVSKNGGVWK